MPTGITERKLTPNTHMPLEVWSNDQKRFVSGYVDLGEQFATLVLYEPDAVVDGREVQNCAVILSGGMTLRVKGSCHEFIGNYRAFRYQMLQDLEKARKDYEAQKTQVCYDAHCKNCGAEVEITKLPERPPGEGIVDCSKVPKNYCPPEPPNITVGHIPPEQGLRQE